MGAVAEALPVEIWLGWVGEQEAWNCLAPGGAGHLQL